jgi:hypothetical protein
MKILDIKYHDTTFFTPVSNEIDKTLSFIRLLIDLFIKKIERKILFCDLII